MVKDKKKWEAAKKDIKKELSNKWFWAYIIGMILLGILFISSDLKTIKVLSLVGLIIIQIFYNINQKQKFGGISYTIILIFYLVIYTSILTKEFEIAIFSILIFFSLSLGYLTVKSFLDLKKSKTLLQIISNYIFLALLIIIIFALTFNFVSVNEKNKILDKNTEKLNDTLEYNWFSAGNFYMCNFGETPYGLSKTLSYIEMLIATIIHVIVIGQVMSNLPKTKNSY